MAVFQADKMVLLVEKEVTYNTDPTPAAANLIPAHDIVGDFGGLELARNAALSVEGKLPSIFVNGPAKLTFKTHYWPVATGKVILAPLFEASSLVESGAINDWVYTLTKAADGSTASVTIYLYHGGRFYKVTGAVGKVKWSLKVGNLLELDWEFDGHWSYANLADAAFPSLSGMPTLLAPMRFVSATVTSDAVAMPIESAILDYGQEVIGRQDPTSADGIGRYWVARFQPKISFNPIMGALATYNPFLKAATAELGTFSIVLSVIADANTYALTLALTNVAIQWPKVAERDGLQAYALEGICRASDEATAYAATITQVITVALGGG